MMHDWVIKHIVTAANLIFKMFVLCHLGVFYSERQYDIVLVPH